MRKLLILVLVLGFAGSAVAALPATGANVLLHLDASSVGQADGTPVTLWPSLAGPGDMITKGGSPTYKTNQINGLPVVSLDSAANDEWMTLNDGLSDVWCDDAYTVFIAGKLTSAAVTSYIFMGGTDERLRYDPGTMYWDGNPAMGYSFNDTANAHIHSWVAGEMSYLDGASAGSLAWAGPLTHGQSLGGKRYKPWLDPVEGPTNTEVDFDYAELIVFDGILTEAERNAVTMYLGSKFDIHVVPEPATIMLLGLGGLALLRKRR